MQSRSKRNSACGVQRFGVSSWLILQFKVGMKCREMERHIRPEVLKDPFAEPADFAGVIVQRRNNQIRYFEPYIRFLLQPRQNIQNGLQVCKSDAPIESFGKGF